MTKFAACFLLVFGELSLGGMLALAIPPFFEVERGFYKSSAAVYLVSALLTAGGLGLLAFRGDGASPWGAGRLWWRSALWLVFCALLGLYLLSLWTERGLLRARAFSLALAAAAVAVAAHVLWLEPAAFGLVAAVAYMMTALTSSMMLGLTSGAMMFGHWYLIDRAMPVDYLRNFVRLLGAALAADVAALALALVMLAIGSGAEARGAIQGLFGPHLTLLAARMVLGPVATSVLVWMCWRTLKIPQTMAATGLLYLTVLSVMVGEMLGRFILFRTALPL